MFPTGSDIVRLGIGFNPRDFFVLVGVSIVPQPIGLNEGCE